MGAYAAGVAVIDKIDDNVRAGQNAQIVQDVTAAGAEGRLRVAQTEYDKSAASGVVSPEAAAQLEAAKRNVQDQADITQRRVTEAQGFGQKGDGQVGEWIRGAANSLLGTAGGLGHVRDVKKDADPAQLALLQQQLAALNALTATVKAGGGARVGTQGRTGPGS